MITRVISIILFAGPALLGTSASSQRVRENGDSTLPEAPSAQIQPAQSSHQARTQFIILLKRRSYCFPNLATNTAPLPAGRKFTLFLYDGISGHAIAESAMSAGIAQGFNWYAAYGQGATGYGKRFGASLASTATNSFFGTFLLPTLLGQDPRFFVPGRATFGQAVKYSLHRLVITQTDSGAATVNSSGLFGPLVGEAIANSYLPTEDRTVGNTFARYAGDMGWNAAGNVLRAYWPTITRTHRAMVHKR
jgi:hypothetical protein